MNKQVNDLIFVQVVQAALVFANALILLIAVRKKDISLIAPQTKSNLNFHFSMN